MKAPALGQLAAFVALSATLALASGAAGCSNDAGPGANAAPEPVAPGAASPLASPLQPADAAVHAGGEPPGDTERGHALVAEFQCNRCHDGTGDAPAQRDAHCVHCHQEIAGGHFKAPPATMTRWQDNLVQLRHVPSLESAGDRLRPAWVQRFLLDPYDLRPRLHATMPRLAIAPDQARNIAAWVTRGRRPRPAVSLDGASGGSTEAGRALFEAKGCGSCHAFTGVAGAAGATPVSKVEPVKTMEKETRAAIALAPDLRFTRDRFEPGDVVAWLRDPQAIKPDTPMPLVPLTPAEARDLTAFLLTAPLEAPPPRKVPERLPVLARRVAYEEVNQRVFRNTCRHCHSEPDYALGDGGPGNTGGFGFKPRGLDLGRYEGLAAGYIDDHGDRRSVFSPGADGRPRLLAALLARQSEEAGQVDPAARGMPLGLPALGLEEIQLVESWIAQGRPQ